MVFCITFGCSNGCNVGKSCISFPSIEKEPRRRRQWIKQVGRVNWTPTRCSRLWHLCQDHFDSSCFVTDPAVYQSVCFKPGRQRLKKSTLTCPIIATICKRTREIETKERRSGKYFCSLGPHLQKKNITMITYDDQAWQGESITPVLSVFSCHVIQKY